MITTRNTGWVIWRWPVIMGAISFIGFLSALLGDCGVMVLVSGGARFPADGFGRYDRAKMSFAANTLQKTGLV